MRRVVRGRNTRPVVVARTDEGGGSRVGRNERQYSEVEGGARCVVLGVASVTVCGLGCWIAG